MLQILFILFGVGVAGLLWATSPFSYHGADGLGGFFLMSICALMVAASTLMIVTIYLHKAFGNYAFIFLAVCLLGFCWWSYHQMFPKMSEDVLQMTEETPVVGL